VRLGQSGIGPTPYRVPGCLPTHRVLFCLSSEQVRSLAYLSRRTDYWDLGPARRVSCGRQKLHFTCFLCADSRPIPASCLFAALSSSSLIIPTISSCPVSSHTLSHTTRGGAPHARRLSRQNVFPSYSPPIFIYHSPIRISLVTRTGCHPDRPCRPSVPTHTQHSHSQVLRI
jgi:hypothetical protein